ncbi:MAG: hypothetical protein AB1758_01820 [Candidatus Eremiobacterota bacterium]
MSLSSIGKDLVDGFRDVRRWVGDNIIGTEDPYSTEQEQRLRDYAMIGAGTGAVAGTVVGVVTGFNSQSADSIREEWVHRDVLHPRLDGYSEWVVADTHQHCHTEGYGEDERQVCETHVHGWWHNFSPRISHRDVGDYTEPTFKHTRTWEPLLGGFLGLVGGAVVGLGVGIGIAALRNALEQGQQPERKELTPEQRERVSDFAGGAAILGTVAGAGVGAWVGTRAGAVELGKQEIHVRNWMIPTVRSEYLGDIPDDYYEWNWGWGWPTGGDWDGGRDPVYRNVPVYDSQGQPTFHQTSKEFKTNRYGPVAGGILGGLVGAGVGLAAGVAAGVAYKLVTEHQAQEEKPSVPGGLPELAGLPKAA